MPPIPFRRALIALSWLAVAWPWFPSPALAMEEQAHFLVLNSNDDNLSVIDPTHYREVRRIWVGKGPHHIVSTPDRRFVVIGNTLSDDLVLLNPFTGEPVKRIPKILDPYHLGFSRDGQWLVIAGNRVNFVDLYHYENTDFRLVKRIPLRKTPSHLAFSDTGIVYVTLQDSNQIAAIELESQQVLWTASTGTMPAGIWITPDQRHLLVGMTGEVHVEVHDIRDGSRLKKIRTGKGAHNFLAKGDQRHIFLSNRAEDTISVIDQERLEVVETLHVPGGPDDMELKKDGSELWVTSRWRNRVSVYDLKARKITKTIRVGRSPHGIFYFAHADRQ